MARQQDSATRPVDSAPEPRNFPRSQPWDHDIILACMVIRGFEIMLRAAASHQCMGMHMEIGWRRFSRQSMLAAWASV